MLQSLANNPLYRYREDQLIPPENLKAGEDPTTVYNGRTISIGYHTWPCTPDIHLISTDELKVMLEATSAPGISAELFCRTGDYWYMGEIPRFLSNFQFVSTRSDALRAALQKSLSEPHRWRFRAARYYIELIQFHPIMAQTLEWLPNDVSRLKLARAAVAAGCAAAAQCTDKQSLNKSALVRATLKSIAMGGTNALGLLQLGVDLKVQPTTGELVAMMVYDWRLGFSILQHVDLSFNDKLSVLMTAIVKCGHRYNAMTYSSSIAVVYDACGESDQWPTLDHVVRYANGVTRNLINPSNSTQPRVGTSLMTERHSAFD